MPFVRQRTPGAERLQAVNTLWMEAGKLWGDNTDIIGFLASLDADAPNWAAACEKAVVLGAGGAARAITYALMSRGIKQILLINRSRDRGEALLALARTIDPAQSIALYDYAALPECLAGADLLVNTTSLGMADQPRLAIDLSPLPAHALVADIVYVPLETELLKAARARGLKTLRRPRHAAASGSAGLYALVRKNPKGDAGALRARCGRHHGRQLMYVLGLTGSIGMGKSATAAIFRSLGIPVHDSDATVHALYEGAAAPLIEAAFPGTVQGGVVDRSALAAKVLADRAAMKRLEAIVHPLVRASRMAFIETAKARGDKLVVVDIPLLFETGADAETDAVLLVTAPEAVQKERIAARPGMTPENLAAIMAQQMPDHDKRRRATFILDTSAGHAEAERQVRDLVRRILDERRDV